MSTLAKSLEPLLIRVRTDATAKLSNDRMVWTGEDLAPSRLNEHIFSNIARGVCPIKAGENVTRCALLDLDSHKGETSWPEMLNTAERVIALLKEHGLIPSPWRSRGGKGIHLIVLWDEAQDAHSVREYLSKVLQTIGFKNGTKGISKGEIEIFPKQSSVPIDGFGNQFILPLAGKSVPLLFHDLAGLYPGKREDALNVQWGMSAAVQYVEPKSHLSISNNIDHFDWGNLSKFRSMLKYVPPFQIGYETWTKIGMALHHETNGSAEGLDLWNEWSAGNV